MGKGLPFKLKANTAINFNNTTCKEVILYNVLCCLGNFFCFTKTTDWRYRHHALFCFWFHCICHRGANYTWCDCTNTDTKAT
eukprot:m.176641 g.176641  ORF g.176641 m.176641 type:complete len:82 (-) comp14210_c0_seq1:148-393(-)